MNKLTVTVDGLELNSREILNIYKTSLSDKPPRVEMLKLNQAGVIQYKYDKEKERDVPLTYDVIGEIDVKGSPSHCGCFKGRKVKHWWKYISSRGSSW